MVHRQAVGDNSSGENPVWRPIETAPKDGSWVLLQGGNIDYEWDGDTKPPVVVGQYIGGAAHHDEQRWQYAWYDSGYYGEYEGPTHWMPLPQPPTP
jgi:hypothetical protein